MQIALWLHLLGVVVWVGGMFFAQVALRPSVQAIPPPLRLPLLVATMGRFFRWVGVAIAAILGSGAWIIYARGGLAAMGTSVHAMTGVGLVMVAIFVLIVMAPYRRLVAATREGAWPAAGEAMARIRQLIGLNLVLGLVTLTIALLGHGA